MRFLVVIFIAILIYFLQLHIYRKYWNRNLSVQICYNRSEAQIGDKVDLIETLENHKLLSLPLLYVKFCSSSTFQYDEMKNTSLSDHYYRNDIFSISGNQKIIRRQTFRPTTRGYFVIPNFDLIATDLFMRQSYAAQYPNHAALYVYPKLLTDKTLLSLISATIGRTRETMLFEDPLSFYSMRKYTNEPMNKINWKASAKAGDLMVNTNFDLQHGSVIVLFNLDFHVTQRSYRLAETCISMAATMLYHFNEAGLTFQMAVNSCESDTNEPVISQPGSGREHYKSLLRSLCRLNVQKETTSFLDFFEGEKNQFTNNRADTIYVVLSNYRKPLLLDAYAKKLQEGYHLEFICPERKNQFTPAPYVQYVEVEPDAL